MRKAGENNNQSSSRNVLSCSFFSCVYFKRLFLHLTSCYLTVPYSSQRYAGCVGKAVFLLFPERRKIKPGNKAVTCLESQRASEAAVGWELEADSWHLLVPTGDKSVLIESSVGWLFPNEFLNISGLPPILAFSLELWCAHNKCVKILKHRLLVASFVSLCHTPNSHVYLKQLYKNKHFFSLISLKRNSSIVVPDTYSALRKDWNSCWRLRSLTRGWEGFVYHFSSENGPLSPTVKSLMDSKEHMAVFVLRAGITLFIPYLKNMRLFFFNSHFLPFPLVCLITYFKWR